MKNLHIISLGCPKALVDSERILTQISADGYAITDRYDDADLVIVKNDRTRAFLQDAKRIVASKTFRALFSKALPFDVSTMGAITYEL